MQIKDKNLDELFVISELSKQLTKKDFGNESYSDIINVLKEHFPYDLLCIFAFNINNILELKGKFGYDIKIMNNENQKTEKISFLLKEFQNEEPKFYKNWNDHDDIQKVFFKCKQIKAVLLMPLTISNYIIGFLCIGEKANYTFNEKEKSLLCTITKILSYRIMMTTTAEKLRKQNMEVNEIAKQIRHDFANDLQTITMTTELIAETKLTEEQNRFHLILRNAINAANERLENFKKIKDKFEENIQMMWGLPIK